MTHYQRVEYRIEKDGQILETVLNGVGTDCTTITQGIEPALGAVAQRQWLREYYDEGAAIQDLDTPSTILHSEWGMG